MEVTENKEKAQTLDTLRFEPAYLYDPKRVRTVDLYPVKDSLTQLRFCD